MIKHTDDKIIIKKILIPEITDICALKKQISDAVMRTYSEIEFEIVEEDEYYVINITSNRFHIEGIDIFIQSFLGTMYPSAI
jgi:hypothetical protein